MRRGPVRDDSLPHQIKLFFRKKEGEASLSVMVTCNCKYTSGQKSPDHKYGKGYYEPMGWSITADDSLRIYNDPTNHNDYNGAEPFAPQDRSVSA